MEKMAKASFSLFFDKKPENNDLSDLDFDALIPFLTTLKGESPTSMLLSFCKTFSFLLPDNTCNYDLGFYGLDPPKTLINKVFENMATTKHWSTSDAILLNGDFVQHGLNAGDSWTDNWDLVKRTEGKQYRSIQ